MEIGRWFLNLNWTWIVKHDERQPCLRMHGEKVNTIEQNFWKFLWKKYKSKNNGSVNYIDRSYFLMFASGNDKFE